MSISTQNTDGQWVPAIPLPYFGGFGKWCQARGCKRGFWTLRGYRGHYALAHILKLERS